MAHSTLHSRGRLARFGIGNRHYPGCADYASVLALLDVMISVLFVAKNSVYKTMTDSVGEPLDCWDEERDAMRRSLSNLLERK